MYYQKYNRTEQKINIAKCSVNMKTLFNDIAKSYNTDYVAIENIPTEKN